MEGRFSGNIWAMFSAELQRCGGNCAWRTWIEPNPIHAAVSCSASPLFSTSPSSWNFLQPVRGTFPTSSWWRIQINQSLQEWAEHFHPRQELMKYTSSGFAFIWQLFSGTTRFYPEKQWFDLSQNSVKSREHPPCSRYWTDPGILSAAPRKSICWRSVTNLTSKMVTKIITPNFWCAPIIQWNSLFKVVQHMSVLWIFAPCWACATGKILELAKDQFRDPFSISP